MLRVLSHYKSIQLHGYCLQCCSLLETSTKAEYRTENPQSLNDQLTIAAPFPMFTESVDIEVTLKGTLVQFGEQIPELTAG